MGRFAKLPFIGTQFRSSLGKAESSIVQHVNVRQTSARVTLRERESGKVFQLTIERDELDDFRDMLDAIDDEQVALFVRAEDVAMGPVNARLLDAAKTAQAELVTLHPRLQQPFARNVDAACVKLKSAIHEAEAEAAKAGA
jgi:hypothetical protein